MKPFSFLQSLAVFLTGTFLLFFATRVIIPLLNDLIGWEPVISWFFSAAILVFLPLVLIGYFLLRLEKVFESRDWWKSRLRLRKITVTDIGWTIGGFLAIGISSFLIRYFLEILTGHKVSNPPFIELDPLTPGRYYILLIWFPYWMLNILGEEFLWRGVLFPRQELTHGKFTWLVHGTLWGIFHIPFGWQLMATLIPILYIQSYVVQKTQNTWTGIIIHAAVNGPAFIAIALGMI